MVILPNGAAFSGASAVAAFELHDEGAAMPGAVVVGPWFPNGQAHVFIYTGDAPAPYGSFTLAVPASIIPPGLRPICVATAAWTNADYAFGYEIPEWPAVFVQQHAYNLVKGTVSFRFNVLGSNLAPQSGYSINVVCPPKPPVPPLPLPK